jgi:nucleoside-diphosphate-sugar epimerase
MSTDLPREITSEDQLEDLLSQPTAIVLEALDQLGGDILLLGAGGKMGFSLARMLRRAADQRGESRRIVAVSRFGRPDHAKRFHQYGIETLAGDLLDEGFLRKLPNAPNLVFMTGMKFGSGQQAAQTWAMNVLLPARVCQRFSSSRWLAFSTGNVYPFVPVTCDGSVETDPLQPVGEYAMSALGRERMFEYFSLQDQMPVAIVRLNYAVDLRYGVLVDLAWQVYQQQPVDLTMGYVNVIWQGDANAHAIAALADAASPPWLINVAGPELLDVRGISQRFAERFGRPVTFVHEPADTALLNNAGLAHARYGSPRVSLDLLIEWTAGWIERGGTYWQQPTHFQTRDGRF